MFMPDWMGYLGLIELEKSYNTDIFSLKLTQFHKPATQMIQYYVYNMANYFFRSAHYFCACEKITRLSGIVVEKSYHTIPTVEMKLNNSFTKV